MQSLALLSLVAAVSAKVITVQVGATGLTFSPNSATAAKGDVINFVVSPTHTVAQGSFDSPCSPNGGSAIFSGEGVKNFVVTVDSTDPMFFYCSTPGHCSAGMVMAVNAPSNEDVDALKKNAANAGSSTAPSSVGGGVVNGDPNAAGASGSGAASTGAASTAASESAASTVAATTSGAAATTGAATTGAATTVASTGAATTAAAGTGASAPAGTGASTPSSTPTVGGAAALTGSALLGLSGLFVFANLL